MSKVYEMRTREENGRLEVRSSEGRWFDVADYRRSLEEYPSHAIKFVGDEGPCLTNVVSINPECGCRVVGCGTLQFPITIEFCNAHSAPAGPAAPASEPNAAITAVIFADPLAWLHEERDALLAVNYDGASSMVVEEGLRDDDFEKAVVCSLGDAEEGIDKAVTADDLISALRTLCELVDAGKLHVGGVRSARDLTDACNWDAEVVDAFWQIVYHGEVIYG